MKCQADVDGRVCGVDIPRPTSKFCPECGTKVKKEDDIATRACPDCSALVTNRQKFCTSCGWRVDQSIFLQVITVCTRCGIELAPLAKFCGECGAVQAESQKGSVEENAPISNKAQTRTKTTPKSKGKSGQSSESGSSSRSDSPDEWKPPSELASTPESAEGGSPPQETPESAEGGSPPRETPESAEGGSSPRETPESAEGGSPPRETPESAEGDSPPRETTESVDMKILGELPSTTKLAEVEQHHDEETSAPESGQGEGHDQLKSTHESASSKLTDIESTKSQGLSEQDNSVSGNGDETKQEGQKITSDNHDEDKEEQQSGKLTKKNESKAQPKEGSTSEGQSTKNDVVGKTDKTQSVEVVNQSRDRLTDTAASKVPGAKQIEELKRENSENEENLGSDVDVEPKRESPTPMEVDPPISSQDLEGSDNVQESTTSQLTFGGAKTGIIKPNPVASSLSIFQRPEVQNKDTSDLNGNENSGKNGFGQDYASEYMTKPAGHGNVKALTQQYEQATSGDKYEGRFEIGDKKNIERGTSQSSADVSDNEDNDDDESSSGGEDEGQKDDTGAGTQESGKKGKKRRSKGATKIKREKKKERKEKKNQQKKAESSDPIEEIPNKQKEKNSNTGTETKADQIQNKDKKKDEGRAEEENQPKGYNTRGAAKSKDNQEKNRNSAESSNKKDGKPEASKGSENKESAKAKVTKRTEFADVHFHILVSPLLLANQNNGDVHIHFQTSTLGGWNSRKHKLIFKRQLEEGYLSYDGLVRIPKELLHGILFYSYYVVTDGKDVIDEYVYCHSTETNNRTLNIKREEIRDTIHQFDGAIKAKPEKNKGFIKAFKGHVKEFFGVDEYKNELANEASLSFQSMVPEISLNIGATNITAGEELVYQFDRLMDGLQTTYQVTAGLWYSGRAFAAYLTKDIHEYITKQIARITEKRKTKNIEDGVLVVSGALVLVTLKESYGVGLTEAEDDMLCKALLPFINDQKQCPEYEGLKAYFPSTKKNIMSSLLNMVKRFAKESSLTCWLFCMPLLHYMYERYKPYQVPSTKINHSDSDAIWWGINGLTIEIGYFKAKSQWDRKRNETLQELVPYFSFDYLLPRTFMACLSFYHVLETVDLQPLPMDAILATLYYHIKTTITFPKDFLPKLKRVFEKLSTKMRKMSEDETLSIELAVRCYRIASDMLDQIYNKHYQISTNACILALEIFLIAVDWFSKLLEKEQEQGKHTNFKDHLTHFDKHRTQIKTYLCNEFFHGYEVKFMKVWNSALALQIPDGTIKDVYMKYIKDELEHTISIKSVYSEVKIVELYCDFLEEYCDPVQEILSRLAFKAVEKGASINYSGMRATNLHKYGRLLSTVFERSMDLHQMVGHHKILNYTLNWAPFSLYVKLHYHPEYSKSLSSQSSLLVNNFLETLKYESEALARGTITIQDLQAILKRSDQFKAMVTEMKDLPVQADYLMATLPLREREWICYQQTLKIVQDFVYMCTRFKGDTLSLEDIIKRYERVDNVSLSMLCKIGKLEDIKSREQYQPTVIAFGLEDHVLQTIPYILNCGKGLLFMTLWDKKGNEIAKQKGKPPNIEEILEEVWQPTFQYWTDLCKRLKSGDLKFSEFERYFKTTNLENLREELMRLSPDGDHKWVDNRLDQLQKYRSLRSCLYGAQVIMDVVKEYQLEGNFNQILEILKLVKDADTKMNTLNNSMMRTCDILSGINQERANCLETFCLCKPLVDWLKVTMPSGLKELKVFVDLASISAGEGDMEIGKVNCLHSATTGYAPLIFNLDKTCDAVEFLARCQEVWKELASNPKLPKKLADTQRQLDWLKTVKQTYGSVEVTSLSQAQAINANGIYLVGNLKKIATIKSPTLSEVMELRVTESEGQRLQRNHYKYEHLHDLQSRLMLVAGKAEKGKDDVDRFMVILDSVVRLGNIYTKLIAEGCVLFTQWHVKFLCDPGRPACAFINFGFGEDKHTMKGRTNRNEDVSAIIPQIAKFMEQCHQKWMKYIDERREKYYLLNYFTVDQMVILQQELVKIGSETEPSVLIYPMLSAVKHGCTKEDLIKAMMAAKHDMENLDRKHEQEVEINEEDTETGDRNTPYDTDDVKVAKFLQVLTELYPMGLAKEALKYVDPGEIDEGLEWCMENEDSFEPEPSNEEEPVAKDPTERPMAPNFSGWTETGQSLASITANLVTQLGVESRESSVDKLIKALEDLWQTFLISVSSSVSDYLSVEHLGLILNRLAEQDDLLIDRTFLPSFTSGEPNLMICPQSEIYNTVLSVYSHEDDKPLPQSDEVLMCTPYTTLDMVEIFWRRALFADNKRVYCLVNADLLDYDVSDRGERTLERLMKMAENQGLKYRLVVICSSENEYKSRIVSALDKYHRPQLPVKLPTIQKYLLTKLKIDQVQSGVRPASAVDFEKCSVRVVKSWRAGVGKTLYKKRMVADMFKLIPNIPRRMHSNVTIPLHEKSINTDSIMDIFLKETLPPRCHEPRIFHIDISHEVQEGVDALLFQLLVLGCLGHSSGHVWRKSDLDYYIIESMPLLVKGSDSKLKCLHNCLDILPHVMCRSPQESLDILSDTRKPPDYTDHDRLFDAQEFKSATFQRPFQYLKRHDSNCKLDDVNVSVPEGDKRQCLQTLLKHCGIKDPSWSELHHFVSFLNKQLEDFTHSAFCSLAAVEDLPGFAKFVLRFLIQMSRDFSTRSLKVSEESPIQMLQRQISNEDEENNEDDNVIQLYQMRRRWETSPHPYLFFNPDHHSLTFLGFNIDRRSGNLIDLQTKEVLEQGIMQANLFDALKRNHVNLTENFDALPRHEKIMKLCNVMGLDMVHDPDETYELTTDNVKKILAIYMRFRCDIPVIIMGETGCGKTRLVKFMCSLQQPPGVKVENMILMKVHGGTKVSDIVRKVEKAEKIAQKNSADYPYMDTVLFFDEANTTEAIGVIKEIMCDNSLCGKPIKLHERLKIVAACNPYRKHSEELIKRLEQAGLGYHVDADKTSDKLGRVPMRRLVYRVQPLPQSMLPLVWDFGQLNTEVEEMYIRQMVLRYIKNQKLPALPGLEDVVSKILTVSQDFMREQKDECSFVSLRDVERVLEVMSWFYQQSEDDNLLFRMMKTGADNYDSEDEEFEDAEQKQGIDDVTRSLVLALGVCYHACLKNREEYREAVAGHFRNPLTLSRGADQIKEEISRCQEVFLESVQLAPNIAKNQALKENVFMMIVCIELRVPMFLVGKPGSSKSLAKTIVADAMQGNAAHKALFKKYKQAQMVSFQCSPLSVPEGIMGTFRQCAAYQKDKNLDRFVSIVVLDEIGLAEDSPRMPLKTLHPLLEDGCPDDEDPEPYKKVAFIGISNWALDPAKMNRGILVQREVPDITELKESAEGICSTSREILKLINPMIEPMAESYLDLFEEASTEMREFFGLRDFYSLLKMLYAFVSQSRGKPSWLQLKHSILRNFGGLENVDPVKIFHRKLFKLVNRDEERRHDDPDCTSAGMIQACLTGNNTNSESRYLLLLTENYGALTILQQKIFNMHNAVVIFGSSFPSDQEYTQVCRNINRIKVCMETGSTVILLNLENLYESLYDALNQYYVEFGGERYVDLGLGTHRVKCRVHKSFRLIVVAEKQIVYDKFPIPLINRLEKHFLSLKTMLTPAQLELTDKLQTWAQHFCEAKVPAYMRKKRETRKIGDAFMGYHADTCAAIIIHVCQEKRCDDSAIPQIEKEILHDAKAILLWCATPAAVWQLDDLFVFNTYFGEQHHDSLADYLHYKMVSENKGNIYAQITTNSKLMSTADIEVLCRFIPVQKQNVTLLTLQSFDTEQQFSRQIRSCFDQKEMADHLLIVQCDCGDQNADLIACARYTVQGELQQVPEGKQQGMHVVFLIQLPGIAGGCFSGFQCGFWHSVHIDELQPAPDEIPSIAEMHGKSVSALLADNKTKTEAAIGDQGRVGDPRETPEVLDDLSDLELLEKPAVRIFKPKRQFNVDYLIMKCIQPAIGNVKDPDNDSSRPIHRLKVVLNSLHNSKGGMTFLTGLTKHLTSILVEKEQSSTTLTNWLSAEASKPENINKAGTFRRFAVQCLESKVIPLLAGIIGFVDTNKNLHLLTSLEEWKLGLWLQIFNDPDLTQLRYTFIVSPSRQQELQEVTVKMTSMEGKPFKSEMPFSWLVYQQIDEVLRNTTTTLEPVRKENHFEIAMKATEILAELPLGKMLCSLEGTFIHQLLKAYLLDFVHMVHPVISDEECNLLCESVLTGCKLLLRGEFGRLLPSLIGYHMTFIVNDARYKNFSHIVHVWPGCCQTMIDFSQKESNFFLITDQEITIDILALHMLVDHLEPNKEALNKPDTRTKWLRQVCDYRPIVERIFGHFNQDSEMRQFLYGQLCQKGIEAARLQWTRIVVVKLFIEHVCTSAKDEVDVKHCMPLWQTFREGADLKDIKSLEKVERFLKLCHKGIVKKCFGDQSTCTSCENVIEGAPVRLPCDHIICRKCFYDCITLDALECPNCQEKFPKNLNPDRSENVGEIRKYQDYKRRCNSFFMEVVSQLCFAEGSPPSQEVITKLLSYIIGHTKGKRVERVVSRELTIFDDSIDPTPVVRSFLLQQLMQTSNHEIEKYLLAYFNNARELVTGSENQLIELCLLILQCMEDSLHQQFANRDDEITMVTKFLRDATPHMNDIEILDKIEFLSKVKFSLTVVAKHIHKLYGSGRNTMPDPDMRKMLDAAARLCQDCGSQWPRRYFVKQLCRCYGIDSYQVVSKSDATFLRWVRLPELQGNKVKECHDRYIVLGEEYKDLRETVVTTVLNENSEKLETILQKPANEWQTRIKLLLALHREITMNNVYGGQPQKFTDKGKVFIQQLMTGHHLIKNKEVVQRILTNTLWRLPGNIEPGMDLADQNLSCLLTHYFILMAEIPGKTTLLSPLQRISLEPQSMVTSFYPTMPQDELAEIKEAVLAARKNNAGENPVFYRCPNGHPYIIGNCGRAATVGTCKACGREIGGEGYQLRPGNELDQGHDRTETGHILGQAARLGPITAPERKLNRASFAVLRLLTHISMYIGANCNLQATWQSIKPNIEQPNIARYLIEHINLDLTSIQNILGRNKDDVLILIHFLLTRMMKEHTMNVIGDNLPPNICGLTDKASRLKWEEDFAKKYIEPILKDKDNIIKRSTTDIMNDKRLGSDPLLQILYETDKSQERFDVSDLQDVPAVWRYRALITVNHLRQDLDTEARKLPVLRLFLKEEHHLRAIRFVPSIIRLQKMLIQKYSRKLDRAEATTLTIGDVKTQMRQDRRSREFSHLLADYIEAWNCVRESLENYTCPANEVLVTVEKGYCRTDITDITPISHLIPTHKDAGLCSYVLLFFLLKKQNTFLQNYCSQCKIKEESLPKVHVRDISSAHLISYHPDRDLLPMVLANCNYSFEVGQGTRVEYNLVNLERQLMDRFLFSKSIINNIQEIETITYRSESTNGVVLNSLCSRDVQERLSPAVISQICSEVRMKSYPDLCEGLDKLDIAISFLKSVGSDPESLLYDFMTGTLKIENPFCSPKAQQSTRCKHTMSLWITLALERAKFLAKYKKVAFEGVSENFKQSLSEEQIQMIEDIVNTLPVELIDILVDVVFECIVLKVDVPQNPDDDDFIDVSKICLRDTLIGYIEACPFHGDLSLEGEIMDVIYRLPSDREDKLRILTAQSIEVWTLIYKVFTHKQKLRL